MDLDLAADDALSVQDFGAMHRATAWLNGPAANEAAAQVAVSDHANAVSGPNGNGTGDAGGSPLGNQASLAQHAINANLPLLEDELLAELAAFSLHAWFDHPQRDAPPVIIGPPQPAPTAAPTSPLPSAPAPSSAAGGTAGSNTTGTSGTGVSPVQEESSAAPSSGTLFVSAGFATTTEPAADPVIAAMTLARETDWKGDGGTATVSLDVYNGTGSAVAENEYWVTFFVDRGVEGISIPEPTHAVPALAAGETAGVPAVATEVLVTPGAEHHLYKLRAALVTNPKTAPKEPAPLLVDAVSDLSVHWTADTGGSGGTVQTMGGGGGGQGGGTGEPTVQSVSLVPYSFWTVSGGNGAVSAEICNFSEYPIWEGEYTVGFSVDGNPPGISIPDPTHPGPSLQVSACAQVPLWTGTAVLVDAGTTVGTYSVRATAGTSSNTHPLYVVEVTGWQVEWEDPPGSGNWVAPDGSIPGPPPADYLWTHDVRRWTASGINPKDPPAVTQVDWLARAWNSGGAWTTIASATGENPASGDSLAPGDWEITPKVYFEGQGTAQMATPKRFVLAKLEGAEWTPATGPEAGELDETSGDLKFFPDATELGGSFRFLVGVQAGVIPGVAGIKVQFKAYDVDDPSDYDGPIDDDRDDDNVGGPDNLLGGMGSLAQTMVQTDANGKALNQFTVTRRPGDNYRIAVAGRLSELSPLKPYEPYDSINTDPGSPLLLPQPDTSLFDDQDGDGILDGAEELLNEDNSFGGVHVTKMLTVWRYLHVEVDSMGAGPGPFPDDGIPIDANLGDLPAPKTDAVVANFAQAFVRAVIGTEHDQGNLTFKYHLVNPGEEGDDEKLEPAQGIRGTLPESPAYWTVYVQSAYELSTDLDNDEDLLEEGALGVTSLREPEYSFIFLETIRDVTNDDPEIVGADPVLVEMRAVVHEIGHHFELPHGEGVMAESVIFASNWFTEGHLKLIRSIDMP